MAKLTEIAACVNMLKVSFPNYQPDVKATCDLWELAFSDMEGETLKASILACITEDRAFAPSVGEIRAAGMKLHAKASGIPDAYQAYDEVIKMPSSMERTEVMDDYDPATNTATINVYTLKFTHPLIESVARMIGWPDTFPTNMPGVDRAQFVKAYEAEFARVMADAGRLKFLNDYVESKRPELAGKMPALITQTAKRLEQKK